MANRLLRPKYPLAQVGVRAANAAIGKKVLARTTEDYPQEKPNVEAFIRGVISSLTASDFCYAEQQEWENPVWADIYAVKNGDGPWFVKFLLENDCITVLSCHEPFDDLVRANGTRLKAKP